ncbi:MAG: lysostaphin resistance A-like protein [Deltaproteobacteria bacterium]
MSVGSNVLTSGPPRYAPGSPWSYLGALVAAGLIALAPSAVAVAALSLAMPYLGPLSGQDFISLATPHGVAFAASTQVLSLLLVWFCAGKGGRRRDVLRLTGERFTVGFYAAAAMILLGVTGLLELLLYKTFDVDIFSDTAFLREGLTSPVAAGTVVIAVILAPLWEELTFRGFLVSALSKSRLGFWGAALIANVLWTSLHASYSWAGVASVFVAGLILSWLVWRTGDIKPAIMTHAAGNAFALAFTYGFAPASLLIAA